MKLEASEYDERDSDKFEENVLKFAKHALAALRDKGMSPRESLCAILIRSDPLIGFGRVSWTVAEHILFLEIIQRHKSKQFLHRTHFDGAERFNSDDPSEDY